ncbi:MAG TPA: cell division protein ZapA [Candidatus Polarisedimenticolaceae bacterium]|nr:cell division protein ZapA [Candidatus Polarisedimenticolaceae bacterium]
MSETTTATAVTIAGRTYHLRGNGDPAYLQELASLVDARMRTIAEGTGTADTLKVAILAALNLADDYLQSGRRSDRSPAESRLEHLVTVLDEALAS